MGQRGGRGSDDDKYCLTIINSAFLLEKHNNNWGLTHHTLTLRGKFFARYGDKVVDFGACPMNTGFTVEEIIKVRK